MWARCFPPAHRELSKMAFILACVTAIALVPSAVRAAPGDTADLSIVGSTSSPGVKAGHEFTIALKAVNDGPDHATTVSVEIVLDPNTTLMGVNAKGGSCTTTPVLVCTRDSLAAGGAFNVAVRATPNVEGSADVIATVASDALDPDPTNNAVTFTAEVGPESSTCDLWGTSGKDRILGGPGGEVICGFAGANRLYGRAGSDVLLGGAGNDLLVGGKGNDELTGGDGRDRLLGGPGRDRCRSDRGEVRKSCS